jgi:hypothetical protein
MLKAVLSVPDSGTDQIMYTGTRSRTTGCDAALGAVAWVYLVFAYVTVELHLPATPICPLRLVFDWHCPLCGSTQFIGSCLHGVFDPGDATVLPAVIWFAAVVFLALRHLPALVSVCFRAIKSADLEPARTLG